jgi:hypothetical protein
MNKQITSAIGVYLPVALAAAVFVQFAGATEPTENKTSVTGTVQSTNFSTGKLVISGQTVFVARHDVNEFPVGALVNIAVSSLGDGRTYVAIASSEHKSIANKLLDTSSSLGVDYQFAVEPLDQRGSIGSGVQGSIGSGIQGSIGSGVQGSIGSGIQGSIGSGVLGSIGSGIQGSIGSGIQGSIGSGIQGSIGSGIQGSIGSGVLGSIGSGIQGSIGSGIN